METSSPVIKKEAPSESFDFYEALRFIENGQVITKEEWGNDDICGFMKNERLTIRLANGEENDWIISLGDLQGEDYRVVNKERK